MFVSGLNLASCGNYQIIIVGPFCIDAFKPIFIPPLPPPLVEYQEFPDFSELMSHFGNLDPYGWLNSEEASEALAHKFMDVH